MASIGILGTPTTHHTFIGHQQRTADIADVPVSGANHRGRQSIHEVEGKGKTVWTPGLRNA